MYLTSPGRKEPTSSPMCKERTSVLQERTAVQLPFERPDTMHAQQYTNWKFKNTGQYEKAIGHFYGTFETASGVQVPSGLFHDPNIIHVPGQSAVHQAPVVQRDESKFFPGFTTKDGYQVPPGLFHSPDVISVAGQTISCAAIKKSIKEELDATSRSLSTFSDTVGSTAAVTALPGKEKLVAVETKLASPTRTVLSPIKRMESEVGTTAPSSPQTSRNNSFCDSTARHSLVSPGLHSSAGRPLSTTPQIVSRPSITTWKSLQAPRLSLKPQFGLSPTSSK